MTAKSLSPEQKEKEGGEELSKRVQLKNAVRDYGSTVIVFHVAISLASLGGFYTAVSRYCTLANKNLSFDIIHINIVYSGLDVVSYVSHIPYIGEQIAGSQFGSGASTFVVAYAVHKVFAPVRISVTLSATPFIVKYLRARGILKAAK